MSKPTEVIVLCEDNRTFSFTRSYLKRCGISRGIRPIISQRGSGFTFVVKSFPAQANAYLLAKARKHTWLIAIVDADTGTVAQRIGEMDRELMQAHEPRVRAMRIQNETIARLVPRRNIETWILALNYISVNETEDYKESSRFRHYEWNENTPLASIAFYELTRPNVEKPEGLIASLSHAVEEMRRVLQLAG